MAASDPRPGGPRAALATATVQQPELLAEVQGLAEVAGQGEGLDRSGDPSSSDAAHRSGRARPARRWCKSRAPPESPAARSSSAGDRDPGCGALWPGQADPSTGPSAWSSRRGEVGSAGSGSGWWPSRSLRRRAEQDHSPLPAFRGLSRAFGRPLRHRLTASITTEQRLDSSGRGRKAADLTTCSAASWGRPALRGLAQPPGESGTAGLVLVTWAQPEAGRWWFPSRSRAAADRTVGPASSLKEAPGREPSAHPVGAYKQIGPWPAAPWARGWPACRLNGLGLADQCRRTGRQTAQPSELSPTAWPDRPGPQQGRRAGHRCAASRCFGGKGGESLLNAPEESHPPGLDPIGRAVATAVAARAPGAGPARG